MIERLQLIDFQAHVDLKVRLDPRVTTIVGPSDVGKSAILRGLRWVALNRPLGDQLRRTGADAVTVRLWVDGHRISRTRSKSSNLYTLDGTTYAAVASDVPEPISRMLNVDEGNFQGQHDSPYWFADTAGNVAKSLNAIVNLGIIDDILGELGGRRTRAATVAELAEGRLREAKAAALDLVWVEDAEADLVAVDRAAREAESARADHGHIVETVTSLEQAQTVYERASRLSLAGRDVVAAGDGASLTRAASSGLRDLIAEIEAAEAKTHPPISANELESLSSLSTSAWNASADADGLRDLVAEIEEADQAKADADEVLATALDTFNAETKGACPICGGKLTKS